MTRPGLPLGFRRHTPCLVCPACSRTIPVRGTVWHWRAQNAKYDHAGVCRDYYCDACAERRERGEDMIPKIR